MDGFAVSVVCEDGGHHIANPQAARPAALRPAALRWFLNMEEAFGKPPEEKTENRPIVLKEVARWRAHSVHMYIFARALCTEIAVLNAPDDRASEVVGIGPEHAG
jgi:hypothetical protein